MPTHPEEEEVFEGELYVDHDREARKKLPTAREFKFAKLIGEGMDPEEAMKAVSNIGLNGGSYMKRKDLVRSTTNQLLKSCQEKMLLDLTTIVPKAMKKMEQLLDAKDPILWHGEVVGEKDALETQRKTATTLIGLAQPKEKDTVPSLVQAVIQINQ